MNDEARRLNEWKVKAMQESADKDLKLDEAYENINNIQKALRRMKDEGVASKDIDKLLKNNLAQSSGGEEVNDNTFADPKKPLSKEDFIRAWEEDSHKEQIKPQLLIKVN